MTFSSLSTNKLVPQIVFPAANFSNTATGTYSISGVAYKYLTVTATSTLTVTATGWIEALIVGGGGGGGGTGGGYAGGGAGGVRWGGFQIISGSYTVTIGAGAAGNTYGNTTSIGSLYVVGGGGRGIYQYGGGIGGEHAYGGGGSPGGWAIDTTTGNPTQYYGGGAGGTVTGSNRWDGIANSFTGASVTYAAGGTSGGAGSSNTGNGGGSTNNGGSGVVVLRVRTN